MNRPKPGSPVYPRPWATSNGRVFYHGINRRRPRPLYQFHIMLDRWVKCW